jgi:murein L,D-transpeptidase YcbB/YkuD
MEWSGGVADIDMVPRTIFSFCVDEGLSAFARIPRFVSCVAGQYRSSGLRFGLHRTAQADSLSKILAALLLSGVLAGVAVPVNATETPADAALQSSYDPLAAAVDLFRSGTDAPMLWMRSKDDLDRARALVDRFDAAPSHGLSPSRYDAEGLRASLDGFAASPTFEDARKLDRALSVAYLRYARDLASGMIDPESLESGVHVDPARVDLDGLLKRAGRVEDVTMLLDGLAPTNPRYRHLRDVVLRMMDQVRRGGWGDTVKAGGLAPGAASTNVAKLRRRLMAMGDLAMEPDLSGAGATPAVAVYDERLMGAVAAFQQRHGLTADGIAGPATLRALNAPLEMRLAQAMLNLERMRWRQARMQGRRIEVNQPDFRMVVYDDTNTPVHDARVVIGQKERRLQTPEFYDHMSYIVLNPTWTVPKSIIRREILPELQKDPEYLKRNNMILLKNGEGHDPSKVDWQSVTRETIKHYAVVQRPGKGNALGNVKFMFPNGYNIYLHDTPSKHLFASESRAYSHGCVRVERPFALAWLLLSEQTEDPGTMIEETLATGKETSVSLDRPIPINLVYLTSWVDEAGVLHFRDDVYKRDEILARAMRADS